MKLGWYYRRLRGMSVAEVAARVQVAARQRYWSKPSRRPSAQRSILPGSRTAKVALRRGAAPSGAAADATIAAADMLMGGSWPVFHLPNTKVAAAPDWFIDPLTGRRAPKDGYTFGVPYRDEAKVGNIKFVWEMSRHQATTVLAAAWWLTGDAAYAERAAEHLRSWWRENSFLTGVHWVSAIEVGLRLLSWTWIRALLAEWAGVSVLFDDNPVFVEQLYHHQVYARRFHSTGSSANNHLIAEVAGLSAAAVAFPWFAESVAWASWSRAQLVEQAAAQTHEDGLNREQASEYHLFVMEMMLATAIPSRLAGKPYPEELDEWLRRMADALAASLDAAGGMPRYGDADEGRGVLVDAPQVSHAAVVLDACRAIYGATEWWPAASHSILGQVAAIAMGTVPGLRDVTRPDHFPGTGMTILRTGSAVEEIWIRCDAGPHGFLSIAAHGHADALSIELRCGGTEVLADPGTYCYHGEAEWRRYFKGTAGHNTLQVDGEDQASSGGPFLWLTHPITTIDELNGTPIRIWQAHHDGYRRLTDPVTHHRRVELDEAAKCVVVSDWIDCTTPHAVMLSWHLGPSIAVELNGVTATLTWDGGHGRLALPLELAWSVHRGELEPPLGWYSGGFGHKVPSFTLTGQGSLARGAKLQTRFFALPG